MDSIQKLFIASDHAGFYLKNKIKQFLNNECDIVDLGPSVFDKLDDYPDYAAKLCKKVLKGSTKGILICGTGQGMDRVANKFPRIDAAVCWDEFSAEVAREHGNVNVLCFWGREILFRQPH